MNQIFTLPDVGEGLTEAEITSWKVAEGDSVTLNQVVVEIETAKSLVELPTPFTGTVAKLLVAEGETVEVGTPIYEISDGSAPAQGSQDDGAAAAPSADAAGSGSEEEPIKPLVGTGPKAEAGGRRRRRSEASAPAAPAQSASSAVSESSAAAAAQASEPGLGKNRARAEQTSSATDAPSGEEVRALAKPPVRKAAKDAGVDLRDVPATGQHGEVTKKDLAEYLSAQREGAKARIGSAQEHPSASPTLSNMTGTAGIASLSSQPMLGDVTAVPVKGVRKMTARAMVNSAFTAPHVTIFKEIDASATMDLVAHLKKRKDFEGLKVSPLLVVAKAVLYAIERNRSVNATWGDEEILIKNFVNLGIAAATPRGLVVPNIKDAHAMGLRDLCQSINELTATARDGRTAPGDMQQGTFTITNIGSLGADAGTPILNPGEVGILAFGTISKKPWVVDDQLAVRWVTTLSASFDHRLVDGDVAARFLVDVASVLEDPFILFG